MDVHVSVDELAQLGCQAGSARRRRLDLPELDAGWRALFLPCLPSACIVPRLSSEEAASVYSLFALNNLLTEVLHSAYSNA